MSRREHHMTQAVKTFKTWVEKSDNIVFFGGAGVSTESGIPDFRSVDGLYNQKYAYPPETIISHSFFMDNPGEFYRFYRDKLIIKGAKPNAAHIALAKLEAIGKLKAVITQNIDGLHQLAGSKNVLELHGSTLRNYCTKCGRKYGPEIFDVTEGVPKCSCGGTVRPDVVLYGENLDMNTVSSAVEYIRSADMLIVGGTSLVVYPAAGLINYYKGNKLVLINSSPTSYDSSANLLIPEKIGEVFSQLAL
jgi:NAD-dependent deacetylase